VGETSGGQLRFVRQETPITPKHLSRYGIKGNEALRAGHSGFLGESDAGEFELAGFRQNQKASKKSFSSSQRG